MTVENAVFDSRKGAIIYFPSALIATSIRILVESSKKGLKIAAQSLMSISQYIKNIEKINERLKDLLAEIVSDMRSNMTFLAPLLSGIVVGLTVMITAILSKLELSEIAGGDAGVGGLGNLVILFEVTKMAPPYFIQIIIGIYLVEVIFILTATLVGVDSVEDKLDEAESEGVANFLNNLGEGKASLLLKEQTDGTVKGSLRTSRDEMDVSAIAKALGGGGHKKAAGFTVAGGIDSALERVWEVLNKKTA